MTVLIVTCACSSVAKQVIISSPTPLPPSSFVHQVEKTCIVAFTTVENIRETTGDTVKQQLRDYIEKVM